MLFPKISSYLTSTELAKKLSQLGFQIPIDDQILSATEGSPLAEPIEVAGFRIGNRWCIHPMEGWDAHPDGSPSELTLRRWDNFGRSGAKWIWGGEAAAVDPKGRANPRQMLATPGNLQGLRLLREALLNAHQEQFQKTDDLWIGLQLTHSGRFSKPSGSKLSPRIAYHHPLLDQKFGIDPHDQGVVLSDEELEILIDDYVLAARTAWQAGFQFVDIKACHGYLLHEFLSARTRPGKYGGDLPGRSLLLRQIIERIRSEIPELIIVSRLSLFDLVPFEKGDEYGVPMKHGELIPYRFGFGMNEQNPMEIDLSEPFQLIEMLQQLGVAALNISCGSPYYCPHAQRPAAFPPSDGYDPPEDPLHGVCRQIEVARQCKLKFPSIPMVGTGYTYLQEYLPHVAQATVRAGWIDAVGLGRMVLSYPELPHDTLQFGEQGWNRKLVCRTFSDCTTAPRNGLVSGCYPLDSKYKSLPEASELKRIKDSASLGE